MGNRAFKIDDNPNKPDKKQVEKSKDFGKLISNYENTLNNLHKKPLYRNPKAFLIIVLILVVLMLITYFS